MLLTIISFPQIVYQPFNPFPHDKILDQTKLKAFADDKLNVTKMIIPVFDIVENIVGKGEIACTSNFSLSQNIFKRLLSQTRQKVSLCGNGIINTVQEKMLVTILEFKKVTSCSHFPLTSSEFELWGIADRQTSLLFIKVDNEIRQ